MTIDNLEPLILVEIREPYNSKPYIVSERHIRYPRYEFCYATEFIGEALRLAERIRGDRIS